MRKLNMRKLRPLAPLYWPKLANRGGVYMHLGRTLSGIGLVFALAACGGTAAPTGSSPGSASPGASVSSVISAAASAAAPKPAASSVAPAAQPSASGASASDV